MTLNFTTLAIAAVFSLATVTGAQAFTRNVSGSTPYGNYSASASANCVNGVCSRNVVRTGPNGGTYNHSGTATCANGTCTYNGMTTDRNGNVYSRQGTISR
jgi:hypothetical protein